MTTNGYSSNDMIIASCPSAEQVSVLLSSASILAAEDMIILSTDISSQRAIDQTSSNQNEKIRKTSTDRKVSFDQEPIISDNVSTTNMPICDTKQATESNDMASSSSPISSNPL